MGRVLLVFALVALCLSAADKKKKPPDLQVVEAKARRQEGMIKLDGRVRNTGEKPIRGLTIVFDFMATGRSVVTRQQTEIDEAELEPGRESVFHVILVDPVRAVAFEMSAVDASGKDLRVASAGPFVIE